MMKKRLRYTMPHIQLYKQKPEDQGAVRQNGVTTHVATIAKRITAREHKRRQIAPQPEGTWRGDIETSESELGSDEEEDYV